MADYSRVIMEGLRSVGDAVVENRRFARDNLVQDRSYARALGLDAEDARRDTRDFAFRQSEAERAQRNADRAYSLDQQRLAQGYTTDDIREYEYAKKNGFGGSLSDWLQTGGGSSSPNYGLNPVFATDDQGNITAYQTSKSGGLRPLETPDGVRLMSPADIAAARSFGKGQGEADLALPNALAKADQAIDLIDQMLAHPGRSEGTGLSSWTDPRNYIAGTDATDFNVMSRQLQGKAFLDAFEGLKGGGAITEIEGQKASEAIARLSTAQSDGAYARALMELRSIIEQGKRRAVEQAGRGFGQPVQPTAAPRVPGPRVIDGYSIEQVE